VANLLPFIRFASLATTLLVAVVASAKMSVATAKINLSKEKENLMSVTIKRNLILVVLIAIFFLIAKGGWDTLAKEGVESVGMLFLMLGGLPMLGFSVALIVRLWGNEQE
jgi:hypothetical protein